MAQIVLDPVNPAIVREIEERARHAGTSVQAAALRILEDALARDAATRPAVRNGTAGAVAERQAELAAQYPEEYVVVRGEHLLLHTPDKDEAFACQEDAFERAGSDPEETIVIPPGAERRLPKPIFRGHSLGGRRS